MNTDEGMDRRGFLKFAGTGIGVAGMSGTALAQDEGTVNQSGNESSGNQSGGNQSGGGGGNGPIDFGGYLSSAKGWGGDGSEVDKTGQDEVTIEVGVGSDNMAFNPVAVHVDPGTKIIWEWKSDGHNVQTDDDTFKSEIKNEGTFEHTVEGNGIIPYYCQPHETQGMLGALAVGKVPRKAPVKPKTPAVSEQTKTLGVAAFGGMLSTLGLAYFFIKYGGDFDEE